MSLHYLRIILRTFFLYYTTHVFFFNIHVRIKVLLQNAKRHIAKRIKPQMERIFLRSICGSPYKHILILLTLNFDSLTDYIP